MKKLKAYFTPTELIILTVSTSFIAAYFTFLRIEI